MILVLGVTIVGLIIALFREFDRSQVEEDENVELLKKSKWLKKNMSRKKAY